MRNLALPIKNGLLKSMRLMWMMVKIIIPVSCIVAILDFYGVVQSIDSFFSPAMAFFGLPGEASIALLLSMFVNFYAALGVITSITLTARQLTILAVMIGICHELPIESAICSYTGLRIPVSVVLRLVTAISAGLALNGLYSFLPGG